MVPTGEPWECRPLLRAVGQKCPVPLRMVGDDEDEGALSDSDGNTVLLGDDLAKK